MGILDKTKMVFACVTTSKALSEAYNALISTDDFKNPKFYNAIEKAHQNLLKAINTYPDLQSSDSFMSLLVLSEQAKYIKEFTAENFDECLRMSLSMLKEDKFGNMGIEFGMLNVLMSLMEIKARLPQDEYEKKYGEIEIITKAQANNYWAVGENASNKVIKLNYSGAKISLAYCAYLNGDKKEMDMCLNEHINRYGLEETLKNESGNRQPWYYKTISHKFIDFMNSFLDSITPKQMNVYKKIKV